MKINDTLVVKHSVNIDEGKIPCGAVIKIIKVIKNENQYLVTITPFIEDHERTTMKTNLSKSFIEENCTK